MKQNTGRLSLSMCLLLTILLVIVARISLSMPTTQPSYPSMAPLSQYLMADRNAEIAMARSAAPAAISSHAKILVLGPHGFVTAVEGTNGFVCMVDRAWMSEFDSKEFWNPKMRGPICLNPQAVPSILPIAYKRTALALAGQSKDQILQALKAALASRQLPPIAPGAMSYMMSKQGYLNDAAVHWIPHLMFYTPLNADWGADVPGSPVMLNPQFHGAPEPINVFMMPAGKWSDGTDAPTQ
jgi:hypothetical protein